MKKKIAKKGGLIKFAQNKSSAQKEGNRFGNNLAVEPYYPFSSLIDIYETNNTARKCIELYAKNVVGGGWQIVPDNPDDVNEDEIKHVKDFFNNCSPEHTFDYIIKEMIIDLKTTGNAAIELSRHPITKLPNKLFNIPIDTLRVAQGGRDRGFSTGQRFIYNEFYDYNNGEGITWFNKYYPNIEDRTEENGFNPELNGSGNLTNEVMFFKEPNPKSIHYGQSSSVTLLRNYLLTKYAEQYNISEFENGLLSKFIITVSNGNLTDDSVAGFAEYMKEATSGSKMQQVPVLNVTGAGADIKIDKLGLEQKEGSYIDLLKFNREEVYIAFGVPPILLGITENSTQANQLSQESKFHEKEIMPIRRDLEYRLTQIIKNDFGIKNWSFKYNSPNFKDMKIQADIATESLKDGSISINEKREMLGLEPLLDNKGGRLIGADEHIVHTPQGLLSVHNLQDISTEDFSNNVGQTQAKIITSNLLNLKKDINNEANKQRIIKGVDDIEDKNQDTYPEI